MDTIICIILLVFVAIVVLTIAFRILRIIFTPFLYLWVIISDIFNGIRTRVKRRKMRKRNNETAGLNIQQKGLSGENYAASVIKEKSKSKKDTSDRIVLRNIYLRHDDGSSPSEVDNITVTDKAVFVIECKSYNGNIIVYDGKNWKINNGATSKWVYSPYRQNETHVKYLKSLAGNVLNNVPVISIVALDDTGRYFIDEPIEGMNICYMSELSKYISTLEDSYTVMSGEKKTQIIEFINKYTDAPEEIKEAQLNIAKQAKEL